MATRSEHAARPNRESLSKRLGKVAKQIRARDGEKCAYCGIHSSQATRHFHLDHIVPRHHGGLDLASNITLACASCNSSRKDMSLDVWAEWARINLGLSFNPETIRARLAEPLPAI